eukprot:scaffold2071_cov190-Alexandrium_tamarense.AAC.17
MCGHFRSIGSSSCIDYIVGDEYSTPKAHQSNFSKTILYSSHVLNSYCQAMSVDMILIVLTAQQCANSTTSRRCVV